MLIYQCIKEEEKMEDLVKHLITIIEENDERFTHEFSVNGKIAIYDKEKDKLLVVIVKE